MAGIAGSHSVRPPHPLIAPSPLRWLHRRIGHPVMLGSGLAIALAGLPMFP